MAVVVTTMLFYLSPIILTAEEKQLHYYQFVFAKTAGADGLKLFPTELVSPAVIKAMKAVLPPDTLMIPVGGINSENWKDFLTSGEIGFGLGSSLYKAGMSMVELQENADKFVRT